ncbi:MAG TPA: protease complex subunit PrcB family protein [Candidatus Elarobacter sp.]|nr:protease complex subunit PrcB family protein [Candidatus Elarobacter sp.]
MRTTQTKGWDGSRRRGCIAFVVTGALCYLPLAACGAQSLDSVSPARRALQPSPGIRHLARAGVYGYPLRAVAASPAAFDRLWRDVVGGDTTRSSRPTIDFSREAVVFVAFGTQRSTGYGIVVDSVSQGAIVRVFVHASVPGPMCINGMALTNPVDVVAIPVRNGQWSFVFSDEVTVRTCAPLVVPRPH